MSAEGIARRSTLFALLAGIVAASTFGVGWLLTSHAGADQSGELTVQTSLGAPTISFLGASPQEAPGEVWATATEAGTLARYTDAGGWETLPAPEAVGGGPIPELRFEFGASTGRTTSRGGVAVAATAEIEEEEEQQVLIVRNPGGKLREAGDPRPLLESEEQLFGSFGDTHQLLAATEEPNGMTGAYVVPPGEKESEGVARKRVLAYDGEEWAEEPICPEVGCESSELPGLQVVAIEANEGSAWLLGTTSESSGLLLFRRQGSGSSAVWREQSLGPSGSLGALFSAAPPPGFEVEVVPRGAGQPLTVTSAGVWVDAKLTSGSRAYDATLYYEDAKGEVTGSWCDLTVPAGLCASPLGSELPSGQGRSFAWPPSSSSAPFGTRSITGVGEGAILSLQGSTFRRLTFVGGTAGSEYGAALSAPEEGWLGALPPLQLTRNPAPGGLQSWPVPFKRPLIGVAPEPGEPIGGLSSEALAVGQEGQIARYVPGVGWEPEFLLRSSGKRATPTLRAVAWPESNRAYAVGDNAAMWRWQRATGLWQPDPGESPDLARANFTGIAFDPNRPSRGYAIGKQGVLLGFGRSWTQETLPPGVPAEANFTSIAFAGEEALVTYKFVEDKNNTAIYKGGVIVNDGSGWRIEESADEALGNSVAQRVAGLPDGGAAIASLAGNEAGPNTPGVVIERQGPGAAWQAASGGLPGYPTALAAVREGGQVRAILSIVPPTSPHRQGEVERSTDSEQIFNQPPAGQAPLLTSPYPLPGAGLLLHQTAGGWRDEQRQSYPLPPNHPGQKLYDLPARPDPVLALLISPDGSGGWAVGGETGSFVTYRSSTIRTAAVMRYGPSAAPPSNSTTAPIPTEPETATFALGGDAQCAAPCADFSGAGLGPDRWLRAAVARSATVPGMRAFLYAGPSVASGEEGIPLGESLTPAAFAREEAAYAQRLGGSAGSLPVFPAPAESDLDGAESLGAFSNAFAGFGQPLGPGAPGPGISPVSQASPSPSYYSFESSGTGGNVRVIVLDYSRPTLGAAQSCWLAQQLSGAHGAESPAIVMGERDLAGLAPNAASDRFEVIQTLVGGSPPTGCALPGPPGAASAYFFDFPEENRAYRLSSGGRSVPAYGSGTLGYVTPPAPTDTEFAGASGFLLVSVNARGRNATTNVAPVAVRLTPSIGSLALDATDGTLLRRSQPALFEALARRPLAGSKCEGSFNAPAECELLSPEPYVEIPSECQGTNCATSLFPEYTFTSSEPDIADFVSPDPASLNPRNVLLLGGKPVLNSHSGLLCAFNPGSTVVTVTTGGLSYSQKVTVQAGSVQRPCGTTPLRNRAGTEPGVEPPPPPGKAPEGSPQPNPTLPPLPPPPPLAPAPVPPAVQHPVPKTPLPLVQPLVPTPIPAAPAVSIVPIVPPPPTPVAQPTPPSGTSQVIEREEEDEEAYDTVNSMVSHPSPGPAAVPARSVPGGNGANGQMIGLIPALILIAAVAVGGARGRRRPRPQPAYQSTRTARRYR